MLNSLVTGLLQTAYDAFQIHCNETPNFANPTARDVRPLLQDTEAFIASKLEQTPIQKITGAVSYLMSFVVHNPIVLNPDEKLVYAIKSGLPLTPEAKHSLLDCVEEFLNNAPYSAKSSIIATVVHLAEDTDLHARCVKILHDTYHSDMPEGRISQLRHIHMKSSWFSTYKKRQAIFKLSIWYCQTRPILHRI